MGAGRRALAALRLAASVGLLAGASAALVVCGPDGGAGPGPAAGDPPQEPAAPAPSAEPAPPPPPARPPLRVSFKLDPVLTGGAYMGERWVSPPVFQAAAQEGSTFRVEARAEVAGDPNAAFTWTPSDPDAVSASPAGGGRVELAVSRPGRSTLTVAAGAEATTLTIDAIHEDGRWLVTFSEAR
jgi:hypothetical protein